MAQESFEEVVVKAVNHQAAVRMAQLFEVFVNHRAEQRKKTNGVIDLSYNMQVRKDFVANVEDVFKTRELLLSAFEEKTGKIGSSEAPSG